MHVITQTGSSALAAQLRDLEEQKAGLDLQIQHQLEIQRSRCPDYETLKSAFSKTKELLKTGDLHCVRKVINQHIDSVCLFSDRIEITLQVGQFHQTITRERALLS